jgi:hypothetical protein
MQQRGHDRRSFQILYIPTQAASCRSLRKAAPLATAAIRAVAVTGHTPEENQEKRDKAVVEADKPTKLTATQSEKLVQRIKIILFTLHTFLRHLAICFRRDSSEMRALLGPNLLGPYAAGRAT